MVRTQVQLTEDQARGLRRLASQRGVSVAEIVRDSVEQILANEAQGLTERYERAARLIGDLRDPEATDLAINHDHYLDVAFK